MKTKKFKVIATIEVEQFNETRSFEEMKEELETCLTDGLFYEFKLENLEVKE